MKKQLFLLLGLVMICSSSFAQTIKFGSINSEELLSIMPERDSVEMKINTYGTTLQKELQDMQAEFQRKLETYQKNSAEYTSVMREQKEGELQKDQATIQQFNQVAQNELQQKNAEYMKPVIDKVNAAIKKVSDAKGISFVIDMTSPPFLYVNPKSVTNLMDAVKAELGL